MGQHNEPPASSAADTERQDEAGERRGEIIEVEVERGEMVDAELDRLISRRAHQDRRADPDELEPSYAASVRRYNAAREAERRALWADFHAEQAERLRRTSTELIAFHEAKAAQLLERN